MGLFDNIKKKLNLKEEEPEKLQEIIKPEKQEVVQPKIEYKQEEQLKSEKPKPKVIPMPCKDALKNDLDDQQLAAVCAPVGNTCVFAIAGSGKTRVLTYRVANFIDNKIPEEEIMLLTFTNKAADEMVERITGLLGKKRLKLTAGTFHSVASKILRKYADRLGYDKNFKIITPGIQRALIESCRNNYIENYIPDNNDDFPTKNVLLDIYSGAINHNIPFNEYLRMYYSYFKGDKPDGIVLIFKDYVDRKKEDNLMDFDDLLLNFMDLFQYEDVKKEINKQFKYIFVDEYQDINWMQYRILEELNANNCLFVIGDSSQCIYQFRGSKAEYIDIFEKTHENTNKYKLTYNYRSTQQVLDVAESCINHNKLAEPLKLKSKSKEGPIPLFFCAEDEKLEAEVIAKKIIEMNVPLSSVAVLVRRGVQIAIIEDAMRRANIQCNLVGSQSLYETEHVQDIIAFLQLIADKTNEAAFYRTITLFSGIGTVYGNKIYNEYKNAGYNINKVIDKFPQKINFAVKVMDRILNNKYNDIAHMIQYILNTFYDKHLQNKFPDAEDKAEDIRYLMTVSKDYDNLNDFLDQITLAVTSNKRKEKKDAITIITMHKSKGLEWPIVFLPFCDKGEYPRCRDKDYLYNTEYVQDERNLFYVSITRAKEQLFVSYSLEYDLKPAGPSPFLEEIDEELYNVELHKRKKDENAPT